MKVTFEYDVENFDQRSECEQALYATRFIGAIWEFDQKLRAIYKHGSEEEQKINVERVRELLREALTDAGVMHVAEL